VDWLAGLEGAVEIGIIVGVWCCKYSGPWH